MSKHTKGPWNNANYRIFANSFAAPEYPVHAPKRGLIAKAYRIDDARLIAAAPELLDALKLILPELRGLAFMSETAATLANIAQAAINKTEGNK